MVAFDSDWIRGGKDLGTLSQTLLETFLKEGFKTSKNFQ